MLGRVTSGGFGHTVGRNIFCAYVAVSEPADTELSVEVMGQRFPAKRHSRPLYDPERSAILA
jgi:4-methylaminobutanoate oxidase (formaldehyde-forming)